MTATLIAWAFIWGGCAVASIAVGAAPTILKQYDAELRLGFAAVGAMGFIPTFGGFLYCAARLTGMPS